MAATTATMTGAKTPSMMTLMRIKRFSGLCRSEGILTDRSGDAYALNAKWLTEISDEAKNRLDAFAMDPARTEGSTSDAAGTTCTEDSSMVPLTFG